MTAEINILETLLALLPLIFLLAGLGALKLGDGRAVDGEQLGQSRRPLAAAT